MLFWTPRILATQREVILENKVGDTVPSEDTLNATNEELTNARQKLKPFLVSLSVEERRRESIETPSPSRSTLRECR